MELLAEAAPRTFLALAFAFGAVVGSFLNVVIARVPASESVVSPPSRCPRCKQQIAWYDNVPIASWLLLRARCRGCGLPISARYPLVEALGGLLAALLAWRYGPTIAALGFFAFAAMLVALSFIDLDHFWLPEAISVPLLALGLASPLWNRGLGATLEALGILSGRPLAQAFAASLSGAAVGAGLLWLVAVVGRFAFKKEAMGFGDVLLLAGIGAWLGIQSLFFVLMFSSIQGSIAGAILIARRARSEPEPEAKAAPSPAPAPDAPANPGLPPAEEIPGAGSEDPAAAAHAPAPASAPVPAAALADDGWQPDPHHIPFGPFLALAALEQAICGDAIWSAWMGLMNLGWQLVDKLAGRAG